ncbi:MAG: ATP-binding cassette domain-containing protein [Acetobacteraceae bacterium]|nr:ATP-binding cassette domain-containing protein [Acetobacteraceae bacterium]
MLAVRGLTRSFYGVQALRGLDFSLAPGTITALIGPNGAGKTTAFQCISGVVPPMAAASASPAVTSPAGARIVSPPRA